MSFYLVTDATAREVEDATGLVARDTPLGALVEVPPRFDVHAAMAEVARALNPSQCICGRYAVIHHPRCPMWRASIT